MTLTHSSWILPPHVWCHIPFILHDNWTGSPYSMSCTSLLMPSWRWLYQWHLQPRLQPFYSPCYSLLLSCCKCLAMSHFLHVWLEMIHSNGALQPFRALGWWQYMWLLTTGFHSCWSTTIQLFTDWIYQYKTLIRKSCSQYTNLYISHASSYLTNPNATSSCQFCGIHTRDELIRASFDIFYKCWCNFGLMIAYVMFNVQLFSTIYFTCANHETA